MDMIAALFAIIVLVAVCAGFTRCRHPLRTAVRSATGGLSAMLFINLTSAYTGCYIAVNTANIFVSTVLSLPGVLCLLVMKLIYSY